jgi:acyl-CoA thioesterase
MGDSTAGESQDEATALTARMYADDRATRSLGIVIEDVALGRATARMRVSADMVNGHAIAHGGYIFLLADTAFAFACNTYGATVAGAAEIVFVRPASEGDELIAEARERVRFGRSGVYDVTVRDIEGATVAEFRGHSRQLQPRTG